MFPRSESFLVVFPGQLLLASERSTKNIDGQIDKTIQLIAHFAVSLKQYAIFVRNRRYLIYLCKETNDDYKDNPHSRYSEDTPKSLTGKAMYRRRLLLSR